MTNSADAMAVENETAGNVGFFNMSDNHQWDWIVRIEQIENPYIPSHCVCLSLVFSLRASFSRFGFTYSCGTLLKPLHPGMSSDDVSTLSIGGMKVVRQVQNNGAKVLWLESFHRLEAMRYLHLEVDMGWIQQHSLVCLIV